MEENFQEQYYDLIDQLLRCPSGTEPDVLDSRPELINITLVKTLMQVATMMAHQDNQDAAKFLIFIARQLSQELSLSMQTSLEAPY